MKRKKNKMEKCNMLGVYHIFANMNKVKFQTCIALKAKVPSHNNTISISQRLNNPENISGRSFDGANSEAIQNRIG